MNMDLTGIIIKGGYFNEECRLNLFSKEKENLSITYGKNGSGKTNISKAICEYKNDIARDFSLVKWFDKDSKEIALTEEQKQQIFIYNEEYIEQNIKIDVDGLKSIVMFGEQISLDEKIQEKETEFKKCEKVRETINIDCYEDNRDIRSPLYHLGIIINALKENGKWADIDSKIKKNKNKSVVREEIISDIVKSKAEATKESVEKKFNELMIIYQQVSENNNRIVNTVNKIEYIKGLDKKMGGLLAKKVEEPIVNDRERKILSIIQNGGQKNIEEIKGRFENTDIGYCPYCFQIVSKEYKKGLLNSIQNVLNKDVEEHKKELESIQLEGINVNFKEFEVLGKALIEKLERQVKIHNNLVEEYKKLIDAKVENVYKPILVELPALEGSYILINQILEDIEVNREAFNKNIDDVEKIKSDLLLLNKQIAWFDIKSSYESYNKQNLEKAKDLSIRAKSLKREEEIKKEIDLLKAQKNNIKIALDKINKSLEYIFFSKDRLKLELVGDRYCIKSKGKNIKLKNLSIGERNIISLCYFFSQILNNCEEGSEFKDECFIILDDPISSFDFENKVGIYSFLRMMFSKVFSNNQNSKILVFSHELEVVFNMQKIASDIGIDKNSSVNILEQKTIKKIGKNKNDYGILLEQVYRFASRKPEFEQLDLTIGNVMRRVLEAYSTFIYKEGIAEISCDKEILSSIELDEQRSYFENLMYRLVLHGESHFEERALAITETSFYEYIGLEEKVKTAKDILVFLYLLNPEHIKAYFKSNPGAAEEIENWSQTLYKE